MLEVDAPQRSTRMASKSHEELFKIAQLAHNGLAMSIGPVHTSEDGDSIFATAISRVQITGERKRILDVIGYGASICMATAMVRGVTAAS